MNKTLLALYGLKWNPFAPAVPATALHVGPRIDSFRRRVTYLAAEGGFALVTGEPGTGKSAALRILADHLAGQRDVKVCMISRPQTGDVVVSSAHRAKGREWSEVQLMDDFMRGQARPQKPDGKSRSNRDDPAEIRLFY